MWRGLLLLALWPMAAGAIEPRPFDYWILALSWSPQHCADRPGDAQCRLGGHGFVVHGLWPQLNNGRPLPCSRASKLPAELVRRMLPLMPSEKLVQHQWRRHGACTGWPAATYFEAVEKARRSVRIPSIYEGLADEHATTVSGVESLFAVVNAGHAAESIAVQCRAGYLREVRLCMGRDYQPRACGQGVRDQCGRKFSMRPNK